MRHRIGSSGIALQCVREPDPSRRWLQERETRFAPRARLHLKAAKPRPISPRQCSRSLTGQAQAQESTKAGTSRPVHPHTKTNAEPLINLLPIRKGGKVGRVAPRA